MAVPNNTFKIVDSKDKLVYIIETDADEETVTKHAKRIAAHTRDAFEFCDKLVDRLKFERYYNTHAIAEFFVEETGTKINAKIKVNI